MAKINVADSVYGQIGKLLGLPDLPESGGDRIRSKYWTIIDNMGSLRLIHYKTDMIDAILKDEKFSVSERNALLSLRGVIVDIEEDRVCARSFGYTPTVVADELPAKLQYGNRADPSMSIDVSTASFQLYFDGTVLRRWKHKGKCYTSTHKKIDAEKSHFGQSEYFPTIYANLGGPDDDVLFGKEDYSNNCYMFLISDKALLGSSKADVGEGWLFLLQVLPLVDVPAEGKRQSNVEWTPHWNPRITKVAYVDDTGKDIAPIPLPTSLAGASKEPVIYTPTLFGNPHDGASPGRGLRIANMILRKGYSPLSDDDIKAMQPQIRPGESLICTYDYGRKMIKVASSSYKWRTLINDAGNNPLYRYFQAADLAALEGSKSQPFALKDDGKAYTYHELFPYVGSPTIAEFNELGDEIVRDGPIWRAPEWARHHKERDLDVAPMDRSFHPRDLRLRNMALCFTLAAPVHRQVEVTGSNVGSNPGYYATLVGRRSDVINYLSRRLNDLERMLSLRAGIGHRLMDQPGFGDQKSLSNAGRAVSRLVTQARKHAEVQTRSGPVINPRTGKKLNIHELTLENLANLIRKEHGGSLYALYNAIYPKHPPPAAAEVKSEKTEVLVPAQVAHLLPLPSNAPLRIPSLAALPVVSPLPFPAASPLPFPAPK